MKTKLINTLLHKYNHLLKEVIAQKNLFTSEAEYLKMLTKLQMYINLVQGIQLKTMHHEFR